MDGTGYIPLGSAAALCCVSPATLRNWFRRAGLPVRWSRGESSLARKDLKGCLQSRGLPVPEELEPWPRLLIVEDDEAVSRLLERVLADLWPRAVIRTASDGLEGALELLDFRPDLLLADLGLPGMSGLELCRMAQSRRELSRTRVLVLTGLNDELTNGQALEGGAHEFLAKPFTPDEVVRSVLRILGPV